jgi:tetratricopeptide (TPR) repeat protein
MFGDAKEAQKDYDKAVDNLAKAKRNLNKAIRDEKKSHTDLAKALRDEKKAQEDLDAAYNGSKFYDSNLDDLYNYEQQLESLNKLLEKNAELIENSTVVGESAQAWNDYASAIHDTIATTEARNQLN